MACLLHRFITVAEFHGCREAPAPAPPPEAVEELQEPSSSEVWRTAAFLRFFKAFGLSFLELYIS